jgi:hypothetical protein
MKKQQRNIILSILMIIFGWLSLGIGYAERLPYQLNTVSFLLGLIMFPSGFLLVFASLKKLNEKTLSQKVQILNFEKKSSKWETNLYDLCLSNVKSIVTYKYDYKAFGSWYIECKNKRLVYDGKDSWLILQDKHLNDWKDETTIKKEELNDVILFSLIKAM